MHPASLTPGIIALGTSVPPIARTQSEILDHFARFFPSYRQERVRQLFLNAGIDSRHVALMPEQFHPDNSANELHAVYREQSLKLAHEASCQALRAAKLRAREIDLIVVATCTGYVCPGLSARLGRSLGMQDNLQRADLVGMGCAGAMPALQRAHDFVRAYPQRRALVVCVEISSACWFIDESVETIVGNAICADGAAAAVVAMQAGANDSGSIPRLERFHTLMDASYLDSVGLSFENGRQRIVLDAGLRHQAGPMVKAAVNELLRSSGLSISGIDRWVVHAGGRKVLDSIDSSLGFEKEELAHSREILRTHGNMSSPTVLFVLEKNMAEAKPGSLAVMIALGPGLAAETAVLRWS